TSVAFNPAICFSAYSFSPVDKRPSRSDAASVLSACVDNWWSAESIKQNHRRILLPDFQSFERRALYQEMNSLVHTKSLQLTHSRGKHFLRAVGDHAARVGDAHRLDHWSTIYPFRVPRTCTS